TSLRRQSGGTLQGRVDRLAQGGPCGFLTRRDAVFATTFPSRPTSPDRRRTAGVTLRNRFALRLSANAENGYHQRGSGGVLSQETDDEGRGGHHGGDILRLDDNAGARCGRYPLPIHRSDRGPCAGTLGHRTENALGRTRPAGHLDGRI